MTDIVQRLRHGGAIQVAAKDLIDRYFNNSDKCLASIPARPDVDADLVLTRGLMDAASEIERLRAALASARADALEEAAMLAERRASNYTAYARTLRQHGDPLARVNYHTVVDDKAGCAQSISDAIRALKEGGE